jgi:hypothetical protein
MIGKVVVLGVSAAINPILVGVAVTSSTSTTRRASSRWQGERR